MDELPHCMPGDHRTIDGGRYRLTGCLGIGGHAVVYQARDNRLRVDRAVKVLLPEFARHDSARDRFVSEARAMALLDHPRIVGVIDVVTDARLPFLVMELVPGGSLASWTLRNGPIPPRQAVTCALQTAKALQVAHAKGIIHRDVKPHNVLIDAAGRCKLGDFGIARSAEGAETRAGIAMGTEGYMAPEQRADAASVDERADVFGLAVTLWVCLTNGDPSGMRRSGALSQVHPALREVIDAAASVDPDARPASMKVLGAQLRCALHDLPEDPTGPPLFQHLVVPDAEGADFGEIASLLDEEAIGGGALPHTMSRPQPGPVTPPGLGASVAPPAARPRASMRPGRFTLTVLLHLGAWVGLPGMLALIAMLLLVLSGHLALQRRADSLQRSRTVFEITLESEGDMLSEVDALGGDPHRLAVRWSAWLHATHPADREGRGLEVAAELEAVAVQVAAPGSGTWAEVERRIARILVARDALVRDREAYLDVADSALGSLAVGAHRLDLQIPVGTDGPVGAER